MQDQRKIISVITIVYNDVTFIGKTIKSVLSKKNEFVEYIVVDGASTDGTLEVINQFSPDIDHIVSEKDHGISDAFNKAVAQATGSWLIFLNSGDTFNSDIDFNNVQNTLLANNDKLICFYKVMIGDMSHTLPTPGEVLLGKDVIINKAELPHQGTFISNNFFKQYGTFNTMFRLRMDYELFARIRKQPEKVAFIDEIVAIYERGGQSNQPDNFEIFFMEGCLVKIRYRMKMNLKEILRFIYYFSKQQLSNS